MSDVDATGRLLQECFEQAPSGATVVLPARAYLVNRTILVQKSLTITTENIRPEDPACGANRDHRCAEFKTVSPFRIIDRGTIRINANGVKVSHIVFNGNKAGRAGTADAASCVGNNVTGINVVSSGENLVFHKISSVNSLCGTGFEVRSGAKNLRITQSYFADNGVHNRDWLWSDGVTIHDSPNAVVSDNDFRNNTDIDLIFGGCPNCTISNNRIRHSAAFENSAFAGLMLHAWPSIAESSGNYTGSEISGNRIDCGEYRCGFGILIGSRSWYVAPAYGGTIRNNVISGAQSAIVINDATGGAGLAPVTIGVNQISRSGGRFSTRQGVRDMPTLIASPASRPFLRFLPGVSAADFASGDFTDAIPNWWTSDWQKDPRQGPFDGRRFGIASPCAAPSGIALSDDAHFVRGLYCKVLQRDPDQAGYDFWRGEILHGAPRAVVFERFFWSDEARSTLALDTIPNADFLRLLYRLVLDRSASPAEINYWSQRLSSGDSRARVARDIIHSSEAAARFAQ